MAKAKKLASGSWRVQVFSHYENVNGTKKARYRSFTGATKAEAEMMAAQFANDKDRYAHNNLTVREAVRKYIDSKSEVLSPSTLRAYEINYRNRLEFLGAYMVDQVRSVDLQQYVNTLAAELSPKSVKNIYNMVLASIRLYSDRNYTVTLPARAPKELHIPDDDQVKLLLENANPRLRLCILLASVGTLRRGEICGLKYKDVLYDFSAVYVHTDVVKDPAGKWVHKEMPKNASSIRRIVLPSEIIEYIGHGDPEDFVYGKTPTAITNAFDYLRKKLGLQCRFHDLRHYAASILHAIGMPDQYIMERGGWSTDGTLKAVYRNVLTDKNKVFTDKANEYFRGNILGTGNLHKENVSHEISHAISEG